MTGRNFGHYHILDKLGEGGMGAVYKAEDTRLKRLVAIKVLLRRGGQDDEQGRLRFLQEARAASALSHSNIVQIHEFASHEGDDFIVMEFVQGKTLARLVRERRLTLDEVLHWGGQMASALGAAHAAGIVHRDIKPANMIVTGEGVLKVLDFGLARLDRLPNDIELTMTQGPVTEADVVMGTAPYMSPEQAEGKNVDARSDIFSAGAVLYEMLTGRRAFDGDSPLTILSKVLHNAPEPARNVRPDLPGKVEEVLDRCLRKDRETRYASGSELTRDLAACTRPAGRSVRRRASIVAVAAGLAAALALAGWLYLHNSRARWVRTEALPNIRSLVAKGDEVAAFNLTRTALSLAPDDPDVKSHWREVALPVQIATSPPGARVSYRAYGELNQPWVTLGETPVAGVEIPIGYLQFRFEKPGMESIEIAGFSLFFGRPGIVPLTPSGQLPDGMVSVPFNAIWAPPESRPLPDFWLDKFEVTNARFKRFVDGGGYRDAKYWRQPLRREGRELRWDEAMQAFHDATGRPGPAGWELGSFPDAQADFPVSGVSWYEAAAYCESVGKVLPTDRHWRRAAGFGLYSTIVLYSNFTHKGPARVGSYSGASTFGAYDMAGNVKEWVWNASGERRGILGGGWSEPDYMSRDNDAQDPMSRNPLYGFRCAKYQSEVPAETLDPIARPTRDYSKEKPVDDKTFELYRALYAYDKAPLEARTELREDAAEDWIREKVSYQTLYGERMTASLFLPKNKKPPFQAVVWAPGGNATVLPSSETGVRREDFLYLVRTGRAVLYPTYKMTFERRITISGPNASRDATLQFVKDIFQSAEYLQSRADVDKDRIAFYGTSLGAYMGILALAHEPRVKAGIFVGGGLSTGSPRPEVDPVNFAPRVRTPVLLVNGKQDFLYPLETSQRPLFRLLGSAEADKRHALFEGGHVPPLQGTMGEALTWLDKYLGPVEPSR